MSILFSNELVICPKLTYFILQETLEKLELKNQKGKGIHIILKQEKVNFHVHQVIFG